MVRSRCGASSVLWPIRGILAVALCVHATLGSPSRARAEPPVTSIPPMSTSPAPAAGDASDSGSKRKLIALALGELGLAGLVAGTFLGFRASSSWSAAHDACSSSSHCPDHDLAVAYHDRASSFATASTIAFAVGLVGVGSGAALFFTTPSASASSPAKLTVSPTLSASEGGLVVEGAF
jgi:hypothetical protein